jgi:hypothetical protein
LKWLPRHHNTKATTFLVAGRNRRATSSNRVQHVVEPPNQPRGAAVACPMFKLDIEKTYDHMDTNFLQELFIIKGFREKILNG